MEVQFSKKIFTKQVYQFVQINFTYFKNGDVNSHYGYGITKEE